jgi:acetyl-CoA synthetase
VWRYAAGPISIDWFQGGKTNICYNALDKHVAEGRGGGCTS